MLDAPLSDDLCIILARGTGESWGIALVVARDARATSRPNTAGLIIRTTFQGLSELQGWLWRYLTEAFPVRTKSSGDMTFRLRGNDVPFGNVELANTGAGLAEQGQGLGQIAGLFLDLRNS